MERDLDHPQPPSPEFEATTAEAIFPSLGAQQRLEKGSDPDSRVAGLLAAAAGRQGPLDEAAYREFLDRSKSRWVSVEQLVETYGSFGAALEAAGISGG